MGWKTEKQKYREREFLPTPGRVNSWNERNATYANIVSLHQTLKQLLSVSDVQKRFCQAIAWLKNNLRVNKFRRTHEALSPPAASRQPSLTGCSLLPVFPRSSTSTSSMSASGSAPSVTVASPAGIVRNQSRASFASNSAVSIGDDLSEILMKIGLLTTAPSFLFPDFSILRAISPVTQQQKFIAIFKLSTQAGQYGVVKIGYIIEQWQGKYVLKQPVAVKIVRNYKAFTNDIPTVEPWKALYPNDIYVIERSSDEQALARYNYDREALTQEQLEALEPKYYFTMPWFEGCELYDLLGLAFDQFNFLEKLQISRAVVAALKQLYDRGWVHRDLKAENIIINRLSDGRFVAAVVDLDQAKKDGDEVDFCGTYLYIAPEVLQQARKNQCVAKFSQDIYALGILLAELWVGSDSILEERSALDDELRRLIEPKIRHEKFLELFTAVLPNRKCLKENICVTYGDKPPIEISWAEFYFPGMQISLIRDKYTPLIEIMYNMMAPDPAERPALDVIMRTLDTCYSKVKGLRFQSQPCALFDPRPPLSSLPRIEVPIIPG